MNYNKVEICGVNTSKLKVLTEKEKRALLTQMKNGTPQEQKKAREELINGNLRLVLSVIQRFTNRGENLDDLFQVGCIGLIKAIDNFDISQDVRFSTYGVPMIIGEIRRFLRDNNSVRVSRSLRDTAYKAMQVKDCLLYTSFPHKFFRSSEQPFNHAVSGNVNFLRRRHLRKTGHGHDVSSINHYKAGTVGKLHIPDGNLEALRPAKQGGIIGQRILGLRNANGKPVAAQRLDFLQSLLRGSRISHPIGTINFFCQGLYLFRNRELAAINRCKVRRLFTSRDHLLSQSLAALSAFGAVSYTHLDVYKRQFQKD